MSRPPAIALVLVWWPLVFVSATVAVACSPWWLELPPGFPPLALAALASVAWWYLIPPLLARCLMVIAGRPQGTCTLASRRGLVWFALLQLQLPFQRLAITEELLRLVPGLYQGWLRLWGSTIAWTSVWSPGVVVADRWGLRVGAGAVIGARAHLGAHVLVPGSTGPELTIAPVQIGAHAVVGALCAVGPGAIIDDHAVLPATRPLPPFSHLAADGTRMKEGSSRD